MLSFYLMIMQRSSVDFRFLSDGRTAVEITFVDTGDQADRIIEKRILDSVRATYNRIKPNKKSVDLPRMSARAHDIKLQRKKKKRNKLCKYKFLNIYTPRDLSSLQT